MSNPKSKLTLNGFYRKSNRPLTGDFTGDEIGTGERAGDVTPDGTSRGRRVEEGIGTCIGKRSEDLLNDSIGERTGDFVEEEIGTEIGERAGDPIEETGTGTGTGTWMGDFTEDRAGDFTTDGIKIWGGEGSIGIFSMCGGGGILKDESRSHLRWGAGIFGSRIFWNFPPPIPCKIKFKVLLNPAITVCRSQ